MFDSSKLARKANRRDRRDELAEEIKLQQATRKYFVWRLIINKAINEMYF